MRGAVGERGFMLLEEKGQIEDEEPIRGKHADSK
jgi:hypothetical protein